MREEKEKRESERSMGRLVFFVVCALCWFGGGVEGVGPSLVDSRIWYVNETVLNVDFEMAVVQLEFDQELYLSGETKLCGYADEPCEPAVPNCRACDWSGQQVFFHQ